MTPELVLGLVGIFVAVAVGITAAGMLWLQQTAPEQRRIRALTQPSSSGLVLDTPSLTDKPDPVLAKLSGMMPKSPKEMGRLQRRLTRAGYPELRTAVYFSIAEIALPIVLFTLTVLVLGLSSGLLPALFLAFVGYIAPGLWLN
ncbi:MAG TPA: hypothetical protein VFZ73_08870, partial [Gemmatimonadaceae bacterium]